MSQFWKPTVDFGESSTSHPSSRFLNDFEELKSLGKGKSLYLSLVLHLVITIVYNIFRWCNRFVFNVVIIIKL
jgi:hypothetical protein